GGVDTPRCRRIFVALDGPQPVSETPVRHPVCEADFEDDDRPNRIELGERLEPEVHEDSDASSELRDLRDDVLRREEHDEGRDREIHRSEERRVGKEWKATETNE